MDGLSFVQLIEVELAKRNISKEKFYNDSGISSATMSQWRKNKYSPSSAAIKKIEEYFDLKLELAQEKKETLTERDLSESEQKLIELFRKVPEDRQDFVMKMIEAAIENL